MVTVNVVCDECGRVHPMEFATQPYCRESVSAVAVKHGWRVTSLSEDLRCPRCEEKRLKKNPPKGRKGRPPPTKKKGRR